MKVKSILIGVLIGSVALPTIIFGGSFVSSLIAGKTPAEATEILATQLDALIGRVEVVETKQAEQEQSISELQTLIDRQDDPDTTDIIETEIPSNEAIRLEDLRAEALKLTVPISVQILPVLPDFSKGDIE